MCLSANIYETVLTFTLVSSGQTMIIGLLSLMGTLLKEPIFLKWYQIGMYTFFYLIFVGSHNWALSWHLDLEGHSDITKLQKSVYLA